MRQGREGGKEKENGQHDSESETADTQNTIFPGTCRIAVRGCVEFELGVAARWHYQSRVSDHLNSIHHPPTTGNSTVNSTMANLRFKSQNAVFEMGRLSACGKLVWAGELKMKRTLKAR